MITNADVTERGDLGPILAPSLHTKSAESKAGNLESSGNLAQNPAEGPAGYLATSGDC